MQNERENEKTRYIQLYKYYKNLILQGSLKPGERLPSIRRCALERQVSKTTVEASYTQLLEEGYIYSVRGSGFYVNEIEFANPPTIRQRYASIPHKIKELRYDFSSDKIEDSGFNFLLWQRYMKNALKHTEKLMMYGDIQGEKDLRIAIRNYMKETRGIICSEEQIIIGAGRQDLIHILCSLIKNRANICFTGSGFKQSKAIFDDRGFKAFYQRQLEQNFNFFREKAIKLIYVLPSHMTSWGEVMPLEARMKLLEYAVQENCIIIEDDLNSEFNELNPFIPALQNLDGGNKVVYMGSFDRLMMPSLCISFMILPMELMTAYEKKGYLYSQTVSTAEQIALAQFIQDEHLKKQVQKSRLIYKRKQQKLCETIDEVFGNKVRVISSKAGYLIRMEVDSRKSAEELVENAKEIGIGLKAAEYVEGNSAPCCTLSCLGVQEAAFHDAMCLLKSVWQHNGSISNK